ncbi:hypothetical protein FACS1894122_02140 [Alphaproteobacteria bacterium]|nr:hypothetical protein FACS1894122_02140 [Alphaproteobacteria bacterium]
MLDFFNADNTARFYFIIALSSTVFFVLKLFVFSFLDFDSDATGDVGDDVGDTAQHSNYFTFLSLQSILAFLMGFGWIGLTGVREWHLSTWLSFMIAITAGAAFMALSVWLMSQVKKLNKVRESDLNKSVDRVGKAYTRFSPSGVGQIQMELDGKLSVVDAVSRSSEEIKAFEQVRVVAVENSVIYIDKLLNS